MKKSEIKKISKIQGLVGLALANYQNDRDPDRAANVMRLLEKAFELCVEVLGKYPPCDIESAK